MIMPDMNDYHAFKSTSVTLIAVVLATTVVEVLAAAGSSS